MPVADSESGAGKSATSDSHGHSLAATRLLDKARAVLQVRHPAGQAGLPHCMTPPATRDKLQARDSNGPGPLAR